MHIMNLAEDISKYVADCQDLPELSGEEEKDLALKYNAGDLEAGNIILESTLASIVRIAYDYRGKASLNDIIQQGNLGAVLALPLYDPESGMRFMNYAEPAIRQSIQQYLDEFPIKIIDHYYVDEHDDSVFDEMRKSFQRVWESAGEKAHDYNIIFYSRLFPVFGEKTFSEISQELGITEKMVEELENELVSKIRADIEKG